MHLYTRTCTYTCLYICVYKYHVYIIKSSYICTSPVHTYTKTSMYLNVYVYTLTCMYVHVHLCTPHTRVCVYQNKHTPVYTTHTDIKYKRKYQYKYATYLQSQDNDRYITGGCQGTVALNRRNTSGRVTVKYRFFFSFDHCSLFVSYGCSFTW